MWYSCTAKFVRHIVCFELPKSLSSEFLDLISLNWLSRDTYIWIIQDFNVTSIRSSLYSLTPIHLSCLVTPLENQMDMIPTEMKNKNFPSTWIMIHCTRCKIHMRDFHPLTFWCTGFGSILGTFSGLLPFSNCEQRLTTYTSTVIICLPSAIVIEWCKSCVFSLNWGCNWCFACSHLFDSPTQLFQNTSWNVLQSPLSYSHPKYISAWIFVVFHCAFWGQRREWKVDLVYS